MLQRVHKIRLGGWLPSNSHRHSRQATDSIHHQISLERGGSPAVGHGTRSDPVHAFDEPHLGINEL